MNQSSASARESIPLGPVTIALIEDAARDLEAFSEMTMTPGHWPSWSYEQVPDGLALCLGCWRPITAPQLGVEPCPGARRKRLAPHFKCVATLVAPVSGGDEPLVDGADALLTGPSPVEPPGPRDLSW